MKNYINIAIVIVITILIIGTISFFFYEGQREAKYQDCLYQCEGLGSDCLERGIDLNSNTTYSGGSQTPCIKSAESQCKLMCIQKYK